MEPKIKKSRKSWCEASETILLDIWLEKMPDFTSARKNSHIHEDMAQHLRTYGYEFGAAEIKIKLHNFSNRYRKEKAAVGPSGGAPSKWKHFYAVHQILGSRKSYNAAEYVEDSILVLTEFNEDVPSCSASVPSPATNDSASLLSLDNSYSASMLSPGANDSSASTTGADSAKKTKKQQLEIMMGMMEECIQRSTEKLVAVEEKKVEVLKEYVKEMNGVNEALINFLNRN